MRAAELRTTTSARHERGGKSRVVRYVSYAVFFGAVLWGTWSNLNTGRSSCSGQSCIGRLGDGIAWALEVGAATLVAGVINLISFALPSCRRTLWRIAEVVVFQAPWLILLYFLSQL